MGIRQVSRYIDGALPVSRSLPSPFHAHPSPFAMPSPAAQLDQMITGYWLSQAIYPAAHFGIADLVKDGPRPIDDLAQKTSTNPDALYRLLRALASAGILG